ncbi:alpha/beta hydrolase [Mycoplasmatota bacterium WC30]
MIYEHDLVLSKKMTSFLKSLIMLNKLTKKTLIGFSLIGKQKMANPKRFKSIEIKLINNIKVVEFKQKNISSKKHMIFLPGGGFIIKGNKGHYSLIDELRNKANLSASFIDYPIAPEYNADEIISQTKEVIKQIIMENSNKEISLIGVSAGGNLALTLTKLLQEEGTSFPSKLFLISPWVDLTISNDSFNRPTHHEFMYSKEELLNAAKLYANELELTDKKISPIYNDFNDMNIIIYAGTADILYPDIELFASKSNSIILNKYLNLPHAFPVFGHTPERQIVINDIVKSI